MKISTVMQFREKIFVDVVVKTAFKITLVMRESVEKLSIIPMQPFDVYDYYSVGGFFITALILVRLRDNKIIQKLSLTCA